ncbi:MAG: hypothetical protein OEV28_11875 [Nitrospirota bacterium]|nr:hypothetical protein [Nitrospirota bacterium]
MMKPRLLLPAQLLALLILGVLLVSQAYAREPVARIFELKYLNAEEAESLLKPFLSPRGTISSYKGTNALIIKDTARVLNRIEVLLKELDVRPKQVRIKVRYVDEKEIKNLGIDIRWSYRDRHWSVGNPVRPESSEGVNIEAILRQETTTTLRGGESDLLVMSGQRGRISVGRNIPYEEWFYWFSRQYGYYEKNVRFKNVTTGFIVEPRVKGETIGITIIPEVAYSADREGGVIEYRRMATTIDVENGQSVILGSSSEDRDAAIEHFLGGAGSSAQKTGFSMVLTATLE